MLEEGFVIVQRQLKLVLKALARLNEILHGKLTPAMDAVNEVLDQLNDDIEPTTTSWSVIDKE